MNDVTDRSPQHLALWRLLCEAFIAGAQHRAGHAIAERHARMALDDAAEGFAADLLRKADTQAIATAPLQALDGLQQLVNDNVPYARGRDAIAIIRDALSLPAAAPAGQPVAWMASKEAFKQRVRDAGWIVGSNGDGLGKVYDALASPKVAAAPAEAREADAVDTLTEEGWTWDGDQWQRPRGDAPAAATGREEGA